MTKKIKLTPKQEARLARNGEIRKAFADLRKVYPSISDAALYRTIAEEYKLTTQQIFLIIKHK